MKINLTTVITDIKGAAIKNGDDDFLLSDVCINALLTPDQSEEADEKVKRYKLALRCSNGADPDFSAEEIVLIKKLIAKNYPPLVVGRAFEILDPES